MKYNKNNSEITAIRVVAVIAAVSFCCVIAADQSLAAVMAGIALLPFFILAVI